MPRRKGYGIPPTKRIKIEDGQENNENEIKNTSTLLEKTANEIEKRHIENDGKGSKNLNNVESGTNGCPANAIKYLHKKFKKMAAVLADDCVQTNVVSHTGGDVGHEEKSAQVVAARPLPARLSSPVSLSTAVTTSTTTTNAAVIVSKAMAPLAAVLHNGPSLAFTPSVVTSLSTATQSSLPESTRTDVLAATHPNNYLNYQPLPQHRISKDKCVPLPVPLTAPAKPSTAKVCAPYATISPMPPITLPPSVAVVPEDEAGVPATSGRYACPYCKLICNKPSVLQKHIRAHTNERPYPCHPCGFAFKTRSNLYKHCRSRSHTLKLEEVGLDANVYNVEVCMEDDEEEQTAKTEGSNVDEKIEQPRTSIYKPKFHKAAIYIKNNGEVKNEQMKTTTTTTITITTTTTTTTTTITTTNNTTNSVLNKFGLQLKIPSATTVAALPSSRSTPSTPSSFGGSSPSPEFLQRHISKLISENQAIVETTDPFWSKKFYQRSKEGSPPSPLPSSTSPNLQMKKKQQLAMDTTAAEEKLPVESKLAHALLQPRLIRSAPMENHRPVLLEESQPLNLTISKDATAIMADKVKQRVEMEIQNSIDSAHRSTVFQTNVQRLASFRQENTPNKKFQPYPVVENGRKKVIEAKKADYIEMKEVEKDVLKKECLEPAMKELQQQDTKKEGRALIKEVCADIKIDLGEMKPEVVVEAKKDAASADVISDAAGNVKFVRPTSLPLKPGTFVPKKLVPGAVAVLPLISPETPRPNKSYGQLYIGGNAYTYLGLKCSTRSTFCTLHKSQPTYVPLSPEHNKISMYSNWMVRSEVDPYLREVTATKAMACYDSRQRYSHFTVAYGKTKDAVTHSSYWLNRSKVVNIAHKCEDDEHKENYAEIADPALGMDDGSKTLRICSSKIESSDDYTYIRGRGRGKYVCTECGIRCRKPSMLRKHCRTHTDMRPYKCNHCIFSFKTKGNLTKHMKSKAHYKKCIELGIDPVPTIVDESNVDEEILSKQAQQMEEGQDIDESGDEDEDDDDEDEDDNEDDISEEDPKCQLEREVAKSLLSLSKMSHQTVSEQYASAGLVPLNVRPNTYPYNYSAATVGSSEPHTPTLMLISEQKERETVSKNTGLARELQPTLQPSQVIKQKCNPSQNCGRYYFGSPSEKEKAAKVSDLEESAVEDSVTVPPVFPIDLSSKNAFERKAICPSTVNGAIPNRVSEILTPVSEPVLLATICSTIDRLFPATTSQPTTSHVPESTAGRSRMLQAYLKERVVHDMKIKEQYQSPYIKEDHQRDFDLKYNAYTEAFNLGVAASTHASLPAVDKAENVRSTPSPKRKNTFVLENDSDKLTIEISKLKPDRVVDSDSKENFALTSTETSEKSDGPASVIILVGNANSNSNNNPTKKMKTEFISPCNGRIQKYPSVIDDERRKCAVCNRVFNKPSQLTLHMNVHYVGRPFRCDACGLSFGTKGHLHKHLGSDSHLNKVSLNSTGNGQTSTNNPRPFKCDDCSTGFRIQGHLAKHLRSKMHIMKLECLGKLPFGTYAEMERCGINMNDIDTTDCENSLESLQRIAKGVVTSVMYVNNASEE